MKVANQAKIDINTYTTYKLYMSQVTLYIPSDLEEPLRRHAAQEKTSLSSYVTELIRREVQPVGWPTAFREACGSWQGSFDIPTDAPEKDIDVF